LRTYSLPHVHGAGDSVLLANTCLTRYPVAHRPENWQWRVWRRLCRHCATSPSRSAAGDQGVLILCINLQQAAGRLFGHSYDPVHDLTPRFFVWLPHGQPGTDAGTCPSACCDVMRPAGGGQGGARGSEPPRRGKGVHLLLLILAGSFNQGSGFATHKRPKHGG